MKVEEEILYTYVFSVNELTMKTQIVTLSIIIQ